VRGQEAIRADFAGKALDLLQDLVGLETAEHHLGGGPIPGTAEAPLYVVGTVTGSFGFKLEAAPRAQSLFPTGAEALKAAAALVAAAGADDEAFADLAAEKSSRLREKLGAFVKHLEASGATVRLDVDGQTLSDLSRGALIAARTRLEQTSFGQSEIEVRALFHAVLPGSGHFEIQLLGDTSALVAGKVDPAVSPATRSQWNADFAGRECTARLLVRTVLRPGREARRRHVLRGLERLSGDLELR
jgi:hypothetical protein